MRSTALFARGSTRPASASRRATIHRGRDAGIVRRTASGRRTGRTDRIVRARRPSGMARATKSARLPGREVRLAGATALTYVRLPCAHGRSHDGPACRPSRWRRSFRRESSGVGPCMPRSRSTRFKRAGSSHSREKAGAESRRRTTTRTSWKRGAKRSTRDASTRIMHGSARAGNPEARDVAHRKRGRLLSRRQMAFFSRFATAMDQFRRRSAVQMVHRWAPAQCDAVMAVAGTVTSR